MGLWVTSMFGGRTLVLTRKFKKSFCLLCQIADLGLATSEAWSKLTKEESRRQSRSGKKSCVRAAGTLCYMAPEHLESIHTRSTEKSDVYSFAIVVWVILTGREPFERKSLSFILSVDYLCMQILN